MSRPEIMLKMGRRELTAVVALFSTALLLGYTAGSRFGTAPPPAPIIQAKCDTPVPPAGSDPSGGENTVENENGAEDKTVAEDAPKAAAPAKGEAAPAKTDRASDVASLGKTQPSVRAPAATAGAFTVQIESLPSKEKAEARVAKLKKAGFAGAFIEEKRVGDGKETWFRVCLGRFADASAATKGGEELRVKGEAENYIVRKVPSEHH